MATAMPGKGAENRSHPKLTNRHPPIPPGLMEKHRLSRNAPADAANAKMDVSEGRERAGSVSSLSDKLHRVATGFERCDVSHKPFEPFGDNRPRSLEIKRKRNSLALGEVPRIAIEGAVANRAHAIPSSSSLS